MKTSKMIRAPAPSNRKKMDDVKAESLLAAAGQDCPFFNCKIEHHAQNY
jgi:hypothetical protein